MVHPQGVDLILNCLLGIAKAENEETRREVELIQEAEMEWELEKDCIMESVYLSENYQFNQE